MLTAGSAGLTVLRQGWKPVRGETPVPRRLDAQRDSPAPRSGETPDCISPPLSTGNKAFGAAIRRSHAVLGTLVRKYVIPGSQIGSGNLSQS